jgi:bacterial/archaeal transporter family-2 protein
MSGAMTPRPSLPLILAALGSGGVLALMVLCNAEVARVGGPVMGSLAPHATGSVAAALALLILRPRVRPLGPVPAWAWMGGLSGAVTVMLSSVAANTALALSGTLALGLLGQVAFGLAADRWGLLGLPRRRTTPRALAALLLILAGSGVLILGAR